MKSNSNLIWIDMEMTGLDPKKDRIIELATVVTDAHLTILAEGPVLAIHQPDDVLAGMDAWNTRQHNQSGLVERVRASTIDEAQAQQATIAFLKKWIERGKSPMCGNSICQDKRFLCEYMPDLANFFHYRLLDVSSVKELVLRWRPQLMSGLTKQSKHLALEDIKDSIAELVYYRKHFIKVDHDET